MEMIFYIFLTIFLIAVSLLILAGTIIGLFAFILIIRDKYIKHDFDDDAN